MVKFLVGSNEKDLVMPLEVREYLAFSKGTPIVDVDIYYAKRSQSCRCCHKTIPSKTYCAVLRQTDVGTWSTTRHHYICPICIDDQVSRAKIELNNLSKCFTKYKTNENWKAKTFVRVIKEGT